MASKVAQQSEFEDMRLSATLDLIRIQSEFGGSMKEIIFSTEEQLEASKLEARSILLKVSSLRLLFIR